MPEDAQPSPTGNEKYRRACSNLEAAPVVTEYDRAAEADKATN